jgi:hypothetical protein
MKPLFKLILILFWNGYFNFFYLVLQYGKIKLVNNYFVYSIYIYMGQAEIFKSLYRNCESLN